MCILSRGNHSLRFTSLSVGQGTQKCKKIKKIEMSHSSVETHCQRFRCSTLNIQRVIQEKQGVQFFATNCNSWSNHYQRWGLHIRPKLLNDLLHFVLPPWVSNPDSSPNSASSLGVHPYLVLSGSLIWVPSNFKQNVF